MKLELSFAEALTLQESSVRLPAEVERLGSRDDTLVVHLNARERLPRLLQRLSPTVTVLLQFERFEAGRAAFRVETALKALPLTSLTQLLLKVVSAPQLSGVQLETSGDEVRLWLDLQALVNRRVQGFHLTEFAFKDDRFRLEAELRGFALKERS